MLSVFRKLLDVAAPSVPLPRATFWNLGRWLWDACYAAGIPRCCPNDLRRTHASWLKELGVDSDVVRRLLGHTSSALVDGVYGRPRPEKLAELAERSIAGAPQGHDIPTLPAPRTPEKHWKAPVTKGVLGAYRENDDSKKDAIGANHAGEEVSRTAERGRERVATHTSSLHSDPDALDFEAALVEQTDLARPAELAREVRASSVIRRPGKGVA